MLDVAFALLAGLIALLVAAWVLELWRMDLRVPLIGVRGDGALSLAGVKTLVSPAFFHEPRLGAPGAADFRADPHYWDFAEILQLKFLSLFAGDPVAISNVALIWSFPITAISGYAVMRWLGLPRAVAVLCAVLFALLPYHFLRSRGQFFYGNYWLVPVSAGLVVAVASGKELFVRGAAAGRLARWISWRNGLIAAMCLAVGVQVPYYAGFAVVLLVGAIGIRMLARHSVAAGLPGAVVLVLVIVSAALSLSPTLIYQVQHGRSEASTRQPVESELYALKFRQLVYPFAGHRIAALGDRTKSYEHSAPRLGEGSTPALGAALAAALIVSLLSVAAAAAGARAPPQGMSLALLGLLSLVAILIATVGGVSSIIAYDFDPSLRAWNRMSIFIAFFAALALGLVCVWVGARLKARAASWPGGPRLAVGLALAAFSVLALLDLTTPALTPDYGANKAQWLQDDRFIRQIDDSLPPGAMILQLPFHPFPEGGRRQHGPDYEPLTGFLHSPDLRWSYGAIKGTPSERLPKALGTEQLEQALPQARAAGFSGVYVNRDYFDDDGAGVTNALDQLLGAGGKVTSQDGGVVYYPLRPPA